MEVPKKNPVNTTTAGIMTALKFMPLVGMAAFDVLAGPVPEPDLEPDELAEVAEAYDGKHRIKISDETNTRERSSVPNCLQQS